jgi:hypothetical protein
MFNTNFIDSLLKKTNDFIHTYITLTLYLRKGSRYITFNGADDIKDWAKETLRFLLNLDEFLFAIDIKNTKY